MILQIRSYCVTDGHCFNTPANIPVSVTFMTAVEFSARRRIYDDFLAMAASGVSRYEVAVTQTCVLHMLWSQWQTLNRLKHILIYQFAVNRLLVLMGLLSWSACVLMLPHVTVDMIGLVGLMFVGELLGVAVCFVAVIIEAVGDTLEVFLTE
jgi:hypothetical protein